MARSLTVKTLLETHKISSATAFLQLIEIDIINNDGSVLETIYLVKNTENISYKGNEYLAADFNLEVTQNVNEEASIRLGAYDPTGVVRERMEQFDGGVDFPVRYIIVNSDKLLEDPEISEKFLILGAAAEGYNITFILGAESVLRMRFPLRLQYKDRCTHKYKGTRCRYSGALETCDYTFSGANGCEAHSNEINFGGFLGLQNIAV